MSTCTQIFTLTLSDDKFYEVQLIIIVNKTTTLIFQKVMLAKFSPSGGYICRDEKKTERRGDMERLDTKNLPIGREVIMMKNVDNLKTCYINLNQFNS